MLSCTTTGSTHILFPYTGADLEGRGGLGVNPLSPKGAPFDK